MPPTDAQPAVYRDSNRRANEHVCTAGRDVKAAGENAVLKVARPPDCFAQVGVGDPWILERSATRLREADLDIFSKLGKQGLEWRLEPEAFTGREVGRQDDLLDVLVGYPVDIEVARQPSA